MIMRNKSLFTMMCVS